MSSQDDESFWGVVLTSYMEDTSEEEIGRLLGVFVEEFQFCMLPPLPLRPKPKKASKPVRAYRWARDQVNGVGWFFYRLAFFFTSKERSEWKNYQVRTLVVGIWLLAIVVWIDLGISFGFI